MLVLVLSILISAPALWTYNLYPTPAYRTGKGCFPGIDNLTAALLNLFLTNGAFESPVVLLAILTFLLILKMRKISKDRKGLTTSQDKEKKRELQATVTMIFLGAIQCALYIPTGIFAGLYQVQVLLKFFNFNISINLANIIISMTRMSASLTILCHLYNLYLYLYRVHAFRSDLKNLNPCKFLIKNNGHREKVNGSGSLPTR